MSLGTSTILLYLSGKEIAATETNTLTINGVELAGGAGDLTHASGALLWNRDESLSGSMDQTGLALWNRDLQLSSNVSSISGNLNTTGQNLWLRDVSLSGNMNATGLNLWNRDLELSNNLAAVSGIAGGWDHASGTLLWNRDISLSGSLVGLSDEVALISGQIGGGGLSLASGAYLQNRANHTGLQSSETVIQALDIWTGIENLTNAYNDRLVTLNSTTGTSIMLPSGLFNGFSISFWNSNTGNWTFSGSPTLYNLEDELLYSHTLDYKAFSSFVFKGVETGWLVFVDGGRMSIDQTLNPPTVAYDLGSGFDVGSVVLDNLSGFNVCIDPTDDNARWSKLNEEAIAVSVSAEDEELITGVDVLKFRMPYDFYLTDIRAGLSEYATGAPIVLNLFDDGISILSGSMVLDTGIYTSLNATTGITISGAEIVDDSEIAIDVVAVGSGYAPGKGLKLWFKGLRI